MLIHEEKYYISLFENETYRVWIKTGTHYMKISNNTYDVITSLVIQNIKTEKIYLKFYNDFLCKYNTICEKIADILFYIENSTIDKWWIDKLLYDSMANNSWWKFDIKVKNLKKEVKEKRQREEYKKEKEEVKEELEKILKDINEKINNYNKDSRKIILIEPNINKEEYSYIIATKNEKYEFKKPYVYEELKEFINIITIVDNIKL